MHSCYKGFLLSSCAVNSGSYYVTQRWLGGMLTNWLTIKGCIENLQLFFELCLLLLRIVYLKVLILLFFLT